LVSYIKEEYKLGCSRVGGWEWYVGLCGEVSGDSNKLRNEKLYDLYSLPSILQLIKSRRMR